VFAALRHGWTLLRLGRTLARHGVLKPLETHAAAPAPARALFRLARLGLSQPEKPEVARAFEACGPAAIKLGQALATRPDLVGAQVAADLARLQDKLPPFSFEAVKAALTEAYEGDWASHFQSIDETPIAAASVAQVHKAVTSDGRTVAVKVLRPQIEAQFSRAIETYAWAAAQIERWSPDARRLRPRRVIDSFRRWTERELDLRLEAANASELAETMAGEPRYRVPTIDWQRTTRRVLVSEWIDGLPLTDKAGIEASGHDRKALARIIIESFLHQAIGHGFFHADAHQGNFFVDERGRIAVVDFGIMGRLDPLARRYLAEILLGLLTRNYRRIAEIHIEAGYVPEHHSVADFAGALRAVGEPIVGLPVKDISVGRMLDQLFSITRAFDMPVQPHLLLLQKSLVMIEGLAFALDPDINTFDIGKPYISAWIREEMGPEAKAAGAIHRLLRGLGDAPDVLRRLAEQVPRKGAAPPLPPLPELPPANPWPWIALAIAAMAFSLGVMVG
jgi:ubiquinone biosynthesis protein